VSLTYCESCGSEDSEVLRAQRHHEVFLEMLKQIVYATAPIQHRDPPKQAELVKYAREIANLAYPKSEERDTERAAVVKHLRKQAELFDSDKHGYGVLHDEADAIEKGDHLK